MPGAWTEYEWTTFETRPLDAIERLGDQFVRGGVGATDRRRIQPALHPVIAAALSRRLYITTIDTDRRRTEKPSFLRLLGRGYRLQLKALADATLSEKPLQPRPQLGVAGAAVEVEQLDLHRRRLALEQPRTSCSRALRIRRESASRARRARRRPPETPTRVRRRPRRADYARIISEQLLASDGRAGARRQIDDRCGTSSLSEPRPVRRHGAQPWNRLVAAAEPDGDEIEASGLGLLSENVSR